MPARPTPKTRLVRLLEGSLSAARNAALKTAGTNVVAFLDDDSTPCSGWCGAVLDAFMCHATAAAVGGPARLGDEVSLPGWLGPESAGYLGLLDLGPKEHACARWDYPYGCNFAVRRATALDAGGFRTDLGYRANRPLPNEETELFRRLQAAGHEVWYIPQAVVVHHVAPGRLRPSWLVRRAFWQGVADRRTQTLHEDRHIPGRAHALLLGLRWIAAAGVGLVREPRGNACDHALRAVRAAGSLGRG